MEVELLLDVESEDGYKAYSPFDQLQDKNLSVDNNIAISPTSDVSMVKVGEAKGQDLPESNVAGAHIRKCLNQLEHLRQQKVQAGILPACPFANHLEFQFVQWMVENDVSQGA
ncbi:hypothetical protein RhiTH_011415 [Rhizoctonia solani]